MMILILSACEGGDGKKISYEVTCEQVTCPNADSVAIGQDVVSCNWNCVEFGGYVDVAVFLTFIYQNRCWRLLNDPEPQAGYCVDVGQQRSNAGE